MNKKILTLLLICFVVLSAGAQVESAKSAAESKQKSEQQSKAAQERMKAQEANKTNPQENNPNAPVIAFDKMVHDYGTLTQNDDGKCTFTFTNNGKEPLILSNVRSS